MMRLYISFILFVTSLTTYTQPCDYDFCNDILQRDTLVGKIVKLFNGTTDFAIDYDLYNLTDTFLINRLKTENSTIERKYLESGSIVEIVYVSNIPTRIFDDGSGSKQRRFFIVKKGEDYYPVDCDNVIDLTAPDITEISRLRDSIYLDYPKECLFCYDNLDKIDKYSSYYACQLIDKDIDTILYSKLLTHGFRRINHISIIMWFENGQGYVKSYHKTKFREPIRESEIYPFDWSILLKEYSEHFDNFKPGIFGGEHYNGNYEVTLLLPEKNFQNMARIDYNMIETDNFSLGNGIETDFYYYLERIFKLLR